MELMLRFYNRDRIAISQTHCTRKSRKSLGAVGAYIRGASPCQFTGEGNSSRNTKFVSLFLKRSMKQDMLLFCFLRLLSGHYQLPSSFHVRDIYCIVSMYIELPHEVTGIWNMFAITKQQCYFASLLWV